MNKLLVIAPLSFLLVACSSKAEEVAVIRGNAYGLWSPTHPHVTSGRSKPNSPVLYTPPPPPDPEPEIVEEVAVVNDVCPTLQSAPHLCQNPIE